MRLAILLASLLSPSGEAESAFYQLGDAIEKYVIGPEQRTLTVGSVHILGTDEVSDAIVREQLCLYPGQNLHYWRLHLAEIRLAALGVFEIDFRRGIRPRVFALKPEMDEDDGFRDILIQVVEKKGKQTP